MNQEETKAQKPPAGDGSMLQAGEIIRRGDLFIDDGGRRHDLDKYGRVFGVRALGHPVKKAGWWFRPLE